MIRLSRKLISLAMLTALLVSTLAVAIPTASAQGGTEWSGSGWVKSATVVDLTGNSPLTQTQAFTAGHSYNVTLQIKPDTTVSNVQFQVSLLANLTQVPGQAAFFVVKSPNYAGYNRSSFTGGTKIVTFNQVADTLRLSVLFQIPTSITNQSASYNYLTGKVTRAADLTQNINALISVVVISGSSAGAFSATIEDQVIQRYLVLYNQTSNLLSSGKISQAYAPLVTSVLGEAQVLYGLGYPDEGIKTLNTITPQAFPAPPNNSLQTYLFAGLGIAVVLVILLVVIMARGRGKSGYASSVIGEVQKEMAVLEVTAAKYDRALADRLKSLRDRLGETG
jgi:hypothetical protein